VLLLCTVVAGAAAYALGSRLAPTYEARASLLTGPINTDYGTLRASGELARTYAELASSGPVVTQAAKDAGVEGTADELRESVRATANQVTRIVSVRVQDGDPERASAFANAVADRLTRLSTDQPPQELESVGELLDARELEGLPEGILERIRAAVNRVYSPPPEGRLDIVDEATPPTEPVGPAVQLMTILAGLAGLVGAGAFVLLREYTRDAIHDEEDLAGIVDVPLLGSVPASGRASPNDGLVVVKLPESSAAADYRVLAAKLGVFEDDSSFRSLLVIAADDAGGSGTLAANLAAALAEGNARVTLVDANTVEGEITELMNLGERPGYGDVIRRSEDGAPAPPDVDGLRVQQAATLDVLPRGANGGPDVLEPEQARLLLENLLSETDIVVLNAPPVERSPSTLVWARVADATVLVVRRGNSKRETVGDAVKTLSVVGGNLIGTVFREGRRLSLRRS
jgi:receptor protein-tyrosine kinase